MHRSRASLLLTAAALCGFSLPAGAADREDTIKAARVAERDTCPITPQAVIANEISKTKEVAFLGALLAGVAGDVVKGGLNAAGAAIEAASKEHGFVAEGTASYDAYRLITRDNQHKIGRLVPLSGCIVIFREASEGNIDDLPDAQELADFKRFSTESGNPTDLFSDKADKQSVVINALKAIGLRKTPSLYIEIALIPSEEGMILRPVFVWYKDKLQGAPQSLSASELQLDFATPGASDIGTIFASARLPLPKIKPGQTLNWNDLEGSRSVVIPARPSTGFVDARLATLNGLYASLATAKTVATAAQRAYDAALVADKAKSTPETRATVVTTGDALADAEDELKEATTAANVAKPPTLGATNVKARFVVIRDENKFGLAIAAILKGKSESVGTAVTEALTPKPEWAGTDTAYVQALADLGIKQRAYDAALAGGSETADNLAALLDQVRIAKAKVNEAAVAAKLPVPFPSLF